MTDGLPNVSDWIDEKIEFNEQRTVQHHHIVDYFESNERPFFSVTQVASEFDMSRQWAQDRLDELEELGVLDSCAGAGGRLYWIKDDRSEWPIPPDVVVGSVRESQLEEEPTLTEFTSRLDVRFALLAAGSGLVASLALLVAITLSITGNQTFQLADSIFLVGMVFGIFSSVFAVFALVVWIYKKLRKRRWVPTSRERTG